MRERAQLVVRGAAPRGREACDAVVASAEARVVWRCPQCGGLEAMQRASGVCTWQPLDWVEAEHCRPVRDHGDAILSGS